MDWAGRVVPGHPAGGADSDSTGDSTAGNCAAGRYPAPDRAGAANCSTDQCSTGHHSSVDGDAASQHSVNRSTGHHPPARDRDALHSHTLDSARDGATRDGSSRRRTSARGAAQDGDASGRLACDRPGSGSGCRSQEVRAMAELDRTEQPS